MKSLQKHLDDPIMITGLILAGSPLLAGARSSVVLITNFLSSFALFYLFNEQLDLQFSVGLLCFVIH